METLRIKVADRNQIVSALSGLMLVPSQGANVHEIITFLSSLRPEPVPEPEKVDEKAPE